ncbi:hypothetical protein [Pseudomonas maumuensis]|uniref:Uncharacterized protein n=1 Tax=Pseudomonas maumuensis TaxID=2842354 RepID=A0ABX8NK55_9PSED|nr:hypothetical protein [Pseudomonas maumuensis]QXH56391.1 hypothetical protein KSS90_24225 [Pseudomonas maumuensis]
MAYGSGGACNVALCVTAQREEQGTSNRLSVGLLTQGCMTVLWISSVFHKRDKFALTHGRYAWKCTSADLVFGYINLHFTFF